MGRQLSNLNAHVEDLPPCPLESPMAQQTLRFGRALLFCGLESALGTAEISARLLWMVCFLLEHGYGSKPEENSDAEDGDGGTEWQMGTGMGDGDGLKDVTDEIEDDDQLEGTRNEKEDENKKPPEMPEDDKEDTAKEVGFDFDAEPQAVPEKKGEGEEPPEKEQEED